MAEKQSNQQSNQDGGTKSDFESDRPAKLNPVQLAPVQSNDFVPLGHAALELFKMMFTGSMRGYEAKQVAEEAFALAAVFNDEQKRIAAGGAIKQVEKPIASPDVVVHIWDAVTDTPMEDPNTGHPILVWMRGDHEAHAPNLPPGHPINQRFFRARQALGLSIPQRYKQAAEVKYPDNIPIGNVTSLT